MRAYVNYNIWIIIKKITVHNLCISSKINTKIPIPCCGLYNSSSIDVIKKHKINIPICWIKWKISVFVECELILVKCSIKWWKNPFSKSIYISMSFLGIDNLIFKYLMCLNSDESIAMLVESNHRMWIEIWWNW